MDGILDYTEPEAGAYAFVAYHLDVDSVELCRRLRERRGVLIVPGAWMGMEGYLRVGLGSPAGELEEGLHRIGQELRSLAGAEA